MAGVIAATSPIPTLVTGGAGFIGSELVASLLRDGTPVTVLDDLSTAPPDWMQRVAGLGGLRFVEGDASNALTLAAAMAGHDRVIHLASSTDIAGGYGNPQRDFHGGLVMSEVVCEAMLALGVRELWYASSGVVYGRPIRVPTAEGDGPFLPESHYAAAKLASEAVISGFAHLYGWRAFVFRFGNTVGPASDHGVVHDLVVKLLRDPHRLEILGDGTPAKPYVAVADVVAGMRHAAATAATCPVSTFNVGPTGTVSVRRVAELVIEALGLRPEDVRIVCVNERPDGGGWPGDTPLVDFDTSAIRALGWSPSSSAEATIRSAAEGIAARYRASGAPLRTSLERRAQGSTALAGRG
jgi:UDP-glucose 4-epimerase